MKRRTLSEWLNDMRWAMNAQRARRMRREMSPQQQVTFDMMLRPPRRPGESPLSYPDAFYEITVDDVLRAYLHGKLTRRGGE